MNPAFLLAVRIVWMLLIVGDVIVLFLCRRANLYEIWTFCYGPAFCVCTFLQTVNAVIEEAWFNVGLFSFYTVVMGWIWWHNDRNNKRRKRLRDKAAARIVNVGGRLKIQRPATDS